MLLSCLTALTLGLPAAPASPGFHPLEKNLREAEAIVYGEILEIVSPRQKDEQTRWTSGGRYRLRVDQVERGPMAVGERILVHAADDWTCEARHEEYAVGQRLLLFLVANGEEAWRPAFGFQSERALDEGRLAEPHTGIDPSWDAALLLEGLGRLVAFVERPVTEEVTAWLELARDPNPELQRFALLRIEDYSMIQWGLSLESPRSLDDLSGDQRRDLWRAAEPFPESIKPRLRAAARGALAELWGAMTEEERSRRAEVRDRVASLLLARVPEGEPLADLEGAVRREAFACILTAARLGYPAAAGPLRDLWSVDDPRWQDEVRKCMVILGIQEG